MLGTRYGSLNFDGYHESITPQNAQTLSVFI
jgi:hypothetical protein